MIGPTSGDALALVEDRAASPPPGGHAAAAAAVASDRGAATAATSPETTGVVVQLAASCGPSDTKGMVANEGPRVLGFTTREELEEALKRR